MKTKPKNKAKKTINHLSPRSWLLCGGGGFEGGEDELRATTWTGEGLIAILEAYNEFINELLQRKT